MKTTDRVMREKFDKESQLVCDWWEHHGRKVKDVSDLEDLIGSIHTFNSHSLAEARREWVEEIRGKVNDMKYRGIAHSDLEARRHNALLEKIEDLLTGDNPEEGKV